MNLSETTSLTTAETPQLLPKVWRVRLFAKELVDAGFFPEMIEPWAKVFKPLLLAKGVPEGFTLERTPARIKPFDESDHGPGIELEFE